MFIDVVPAAALQVRLSVILVGQCGLTLHAKDCSDYQMLVCSLLRARHFLEMRSTVLVRVWNLLLFL